MAAPKIASMMPKISGKLTASPKLTSPLGRVGPLRVTLEGVVEIGNGCSAVLPPYRADEDSEVGALQQ